MADSLQLAAVQFTPVFGDKSGNLNRISELLEPIQADIIVLPELCTSGYFFQSKEEACGFAEDRNGATIEFFKSIAHEKNAIIVAGFAEADGEKIFNSALVFEPEINRLHIYRKSHLFYKERFCFDAGDTGFFTIYNELRDIRIGTMICYDWRFPEVSRLLCLQGADVIVCPSNLVTDAWRLVMPARAIENKLYVAVANRAGTEKGGGEEVIFKGNSAIYGYNGKEIAKAGATENEILLVEIFPEQTRNKSFNALNDILLDRRPELYDFK